tara:strand:+ start:1045 stop:1524 length:480 start_codon:yes stop_codon:yes gene_type:complete
MDFKKNLEMNKDMIRQMAEKISKEQVENFMSAGTSNNCNTGNPVPGHQKKEYDKDYSTSRDQVNINANNMRTIVSRSQTVTCDKCDNYTFSQVMILKRVSPFISPTGEEMMLPVQVMACSVCNHINEQFEVNQVISDILKKKEEAKAKPKRKRTTKKKS